MAKSVLRKQKSRLQVLSLEEKLSLLSGDPSGFATKAIPHLGIPSLKMADGPSGVTKEACTAFPSGIALAATFDRKIVASVANAMALDAKSKNIQILLAPCLGLSRHPFGGRNFETFGEDPFLVGEVGRIFVESLQAQGVAACVKHFALNDQEFLRKDIDSSISRRALLECHLLPFRMALEADAKVVMTAYNKVNGRFSSENFSLFSILRENWKFDGLVISDWSATRDTFASWRAGLDIEMPFPDYFSIKNLKFLLQGEFISLHEIDEKVNRLLRLVDWFSKPNRSKKNLTTNGSTVALSTAEASLVLLKNDSLLPLRAADLNRVAVFGAGAKYARVSGGGSSHVSSKNAVSPLAALRSRLGDKIEYSESVRMRGDVLPIPAFHWSTEDGRPGLIGEYFGNRNLSGKPQLVSLDPTIDFEWGWSSPDPRVPIDNFSIRWTGTLDILEAGFYEFRLRYEYGVRLFVNDILVLDAWEGGSKDWVCLDLPAGKNKICLEACEGEGKSGIALGLEKTVAQLADISRIAAGADVAIVFAGLSEFYESEEKDRTSFSLPEEQDLLIEKVIEAQPNTIVVLNGGNPVAMPWAEKAKAILHSWYGGEMVGEAVARALLGEINPSGKSPVSFPKRWEDCAAFPNYPETYPWNVQYREDMHIGHRHFTSNKIAPLFCFGHGLSYTRFSFSDLKVDGLSFRFRLENSGPMDGAEVAQLYVRRPGEKYWFFLDFEKCFLRAGEARTIKLQAKRDLLRTYDESAELWVLRRGDYQFAIGSSVLALPLSCGVRINS